MELMKAGVIIVGAGSSQRMGGVDKIFALIDGKPLLAHAIEAFEVCAEVSQIVLVLNEDNLNEGMKLTQEKGYLKVTGAYHGGLRRQDSVAEGLKRLEGCEWIIVHDGARPCVTPTLIEHGLREAAETGVAIAAVPAKDTIKTIGADMMVQETLPREALWMVQTPQFFWADIIKDAYRRMNDNVTDDATLVEALGYRVKVFWGSYDNIKVTTPEDLTLAEIILRSRG